MCPEQPAFAECLGHIQGYCKALQKPRIAVHHGIWRDLIRHIGKRSLDEYEDESWIWTFPTSVSAVKHEERGTREILTNVGLMTNTLLSYSAAKGATWTTSQYNFTVGVTGSAIEAAWED